MECIFASAKRTVCQLWLFSTSVARHAVRKAGITSHPTNDPDRPSHRRRTAKTVKRLLAVATSLVLSTPAFAQSTPETVGAGMGVVAGLLIAIVVGAVVGWVASLIVKGAGSGFLTDVLVGIGGSIIASYLFPAIGVPIGGGFAGAFIAALIGAVLLLVIIKLIRKT